MTGEQTGHTVRIGPAKSAFGRNAEVAHDPPGRGNSRLVASRVVVLQQTKIQLGLGGPLPAAQRGEEGIVSLPAEQGYG